MKYIQTRVSTEADLPELKKLWELCFSDSADFRNWYFTNYFRQDECLVADVNEKVAASLQVIDLPLDVRGEVIRAAYIVGVNCKPEYRGLGLTRRLMDEALNGYAKEHGIRLMLLMPFEADFYYSYGFTFGDYHLHMKLAVDEFYDSSYREAAKTFHWQEVERLSDDMETLERVYTAWGKQFDGQIKRSSARRWQAFLDDVAIEGGRVLLLYDENNEVQGYIAYVLQSDQLFIKELAVLNERARNAAYYFIAGFRSQVKMVEWSAPENERIAFRRKKDKSSVALTPFMMYQVMDSTILPLLTAKRPSTDICFQVAGEGTYLWRANADSIEQVEQAPSTVLQFTRETLTRIVFERFFTAEMFELSQEEQGKAYAEFVDLFSQKSLIFDNEYF